MSETLVNKILVKSLKSIPKFQHHYLFTSIPKNQHPNPLPNLESQSNLNKQHFKIHKDHKPFAYVVLNAKIRSILQLKYRNSNPQQKSRKDKNPQKTSTHPFPDPTREMSNSPKITQTQMETI